MNFKVLDVGMEEAAWVSLVGLMLMNVQGRRLNKGNQQRHVRQDCVEDTQQIVLMVAQSRICSLLRPASHS